MDMFRDFCREKEAELPFCKKHKTKISESMIKALFETLDVDGNGILDANELVAILEGRHALSSGKGGGEDLHKQVSAVATDLFSKFKSFSGM